MPWNVLNIKLNCLISVKFFLPHFGQTILFSSIVLINSSLLIPPASIFRTSSIILSALKRDLHSLQSISGSENVLICPDASHVFGFIKIAASSPTLFGSS